MAQSEVTGGKVSGLAIVDVAARGGTRRERGAAIAAFVRKYPESLVSVHFSYSETHGFLSATYARYKIIGDK